MDSIINLSPREAFEHLQRDAAIIDIRPEYETDFRVFDVPKVFYLPYDSYHENIASIPRNVFLIVADSVGNRSAEVARFLIEQGYSHIACLAGGVVAWDQAGMPLSKNLDYELNGGCACKLRPKKDREGSSGAPRNL